MKHDEILTDIEAIIAAGNARTSTARNEVNLAMINHLCDALGDQNPVYSDPAAAREAGHNDVVAPPAALQVWNMPLPGRPVPPNDVDRAYAILEGHGYPYVVAVNCEQEYERYLSPGDLLTAEERVESITGPKQTALGEGYFLTTLTDVKDRGGNGVGTMRFRTLWYSTNGSVTDE